MLPWIATDTIEVLAGTPAGDYGSDTDYLDWTTPTVVAVVDGCSVQPVAAQEYNLDREAIETRWQVWTPRTADIRSVNRIRHDGQILIIDGSVQSFHDPTGLGLDHLTFFARKVDG